MITPERVGSQLPTGVASNAMYAKHVVGYQMFVSTYNILLYEIEGGIENANLRTHFEHNKKEGESGCESAHIPAHQLELVVPFSFMVLLYHHDSTGILLDTRESLN